MTNQLVVSRAQGLGQRRPPRFCCPSRMSWKSACQRGRVPRLARCPCQRPTGRCPATKPPRACGPRGPYMVQRHRGRCAARQQWPRATAGPTCMRANHARCACRWPFSGLGRAASYPQRPASQPADRNQGRRSSTTARPKPRRAAGLARRNGFPAHLRRRSPRSSGSSAGCGCRCGSGCAFGDCGCDSASGCGFGWSFYPLPFRCPSLSRAHVL
mmetsp:Transcript_48761/g.96574  ORF Transcript_48761/g.96574 Transcript_48761/m.96574 type:complete len:214 (-) Transcript_48761:359-1000(-)